MIATAFFLCLHLSFFTKNYLINLKSSFYDFYVYLTILCSLRDYFMTIDNYFMIICDYSMFIDDYFMIINDDFMIIIVIIIVKLLFM